MTQWDMDHFNTNNITNVGVMYYSMTSQVKKSATKHGLPAGTKCTKLSMEGHFKYCIDEDWKVTIVINFFS